MRIRAKRKIGNKFFGILGKVRNPFPVNAVPVYKPFEYAIILNNFQKGLGFFTPNANAKQADAILALGKIFLRDSGNPANDIDYQTKIFNLSNDLNLTNSDWLNIIEMIRQKVYPFDTLPANLSAFEQKNGEYILNILTDSPHLFLNYVKAKNQSVQRNDNNITPLVVNSEVVSQMDSDAFQGRQAQPQTLAEETKKTNYLPYLIAGGAVLAYFVFKKK